MRNDFEDSKKLEALTRAENLIEYAERINLLIVQSLLMPQMTLKTANDKPGQKVLVKKLKSLASTEKTTANGIFNIRRITCVAGDRFPPTKTRGSYYILVKPSQRNND